MSFCVFVSVFCYKLLNMELMIQRSNAYAIFSTPAKSLSVGTVPFSFPPEMGESAYSLCVVKLLYFC